VNKGDLIKRNDTWKDWIEDGGGWMTSQEEQEIGVMLENDEGWIVVHWPVTGISWEDADTVEEINESR
jgi:hypothetical protein